MKDLYHNLKSVQSNSSMSEVFNNILDKDTNFVHIKRTPFLDLSKIEKLKLLSFDKIKIDEISYIQKIENIFSQMQRYEDERNLLKRDILSILRECFNLSDLYVPCEISLKLVTGVPCTKLHADFLPLRLICTYSGAGTLYLPRESTRYPCLNEGRANKRVHIKGTPSYQANTFDLLLLKGRKFNKGELRPCAHRSPEGGVNERRLVLKIDFK